LFDIRKAGWYEKNYPTLPQIEELKRRSQLAAPEAIRLNARGEISIALPANGVALLEL
jgi:hypothetical protein